MPPSSRDSAAAAGWTCGAPGTYAELIPPRTHALFWLKPGILWRSRNDVLARVFGDPTDDERRRWVAAQGADPDRTIVRDDPDTYSFMVLGDTGEGDASQYAVVP